MKTGTYIFAVDPVALPAVPTSLVATGGAGQISLAWSAAGGATGYSVHRGTTASGPYTTQATNVVGTSYVDSAVVNGTTYYYVVSATNAEGESNDSNEASATPSAGPTQVTLNSTGSEDGWVRESGENTNVGSNTGAGATTTSAIRAGDNNTDRQYKGLVSFDTASIPDGATITAVTLRLKRGTVSGTNPFTTHGTCWVDVQSGGFSGSNALQSADFEASATAVQSTSLSNAASNGSWSEGNLNAAGLAAVNKTGTTQFRVYFNLDDNDDGGNDYLGYYGGNNSTSANRPQLVVTYQ